MGSSLLQGYLSTKPGQVHYTPATEYGYPETLITGPPGTQLTETLSYDLGTGLVTSAVDPNLQETTFTYDSSGRVTTQTLPDGTVLLQSYTDDGPEPAIATLTTIEATTNTARTDRVVFDGSGRPIRSEVLNGTGTDTYSRVETLYDGLGRTVQTSNPYDPDAPPSGGVLWTRFAYDGLGRLTQVTPPPLQGSQSADTTTYVYAGNQTTVTDPVGNQRRLYVDALGRLIRVDEPGYADATQAAGSVQILGARDSRVCPPLQLTVYDEGTVTVEVTVAGGEVFSVSVPYNQSTNVTASETAAALAAAFDASGAPVNAAVASDTLQLTAQEYGERRLRPGIHAVEIGVGSHSRRTVASR